MSARDLLRKFKSLPEHEQQEFASEFRDWEKQSRARVEKAQKATGTETPVQWPDVSERQKKIFGDRVLPNLVLQAREEERF